MPSYLWKGKGRGGQIQEGVMLADTRDAAVATLRRQQIQVTSIKEKGKECPLIPKLPVIIGDKVIAVFTRQFSVMLDAGLPLVQCLEILGEQEEDRGFREIIQQVRSDVESGAYPEPQHLVDVDADVVASFVAALDDTAPEESR